MGNGLVEFNSYHGPSSRSLSAARSSTFLDDATYSSDDDDDGNPFSTFLRAVQGHGVFSGTGLHVVRPVSFTSHIASRSYATNINDREAGNGVENPLEIDDSDEEVEVVHVRPGA